MRRRALATTVLALVVGGGASFGQTPVGAPVPVQEGREFLAENGKRPGVQKTASGLQYEILEAGTGPKPAATDRVSVHYRGTLIDGREFDSSHRRGQPSVFGLNRVITGFHEALLLMPVGSTWKVYIPSELAYGEEGVPDAAIPPNATLVFDVELLGIVPLTIKP